MLGLSKEMIVILGGATILIIVAVLIGVLIHKRKNRNQTVAVSGGFASSNDDANPTL